ncbi:MAG: hypothetical protein EPO25_06385 [Gammaproteobacteria bacterium]|nr:MAG: hypothetical protein EPO25_06385 [Gammaproteobacteria bacterium]
MIWVDTMLGDGRNTMHETCHVTRSRHLQRYLVELSYRFNRRFDLAAMVGRPGRAAAATSPMLYRLVELDEVQW